MSPRHKESVRNHPWLFSVGILLHLGVLAALTQLALELLAKQAAVEVAFFTGCVAGVSLLAGLILLARRFRSTTLRSMSHFDDYFANLAVGTLLALTALRGMEWLGPHVLLGYAIAFFLYLPLGKLRHAVFFFVARADFGARLGYRGVYREAPPSTGGKHVLRG